MYIRSRRGDDGGLEAGAVGLADREGSRAVLDSGDGTVAVVAGTLALLNDAAKASETSDRMAMTFMLTEFSLEEVETVKLATKLNKSGPLFVDLREKLRG